MLLEQHRVWRQDALKFSAQFCEDFGADADLDDATPIATGGSAIPNLSTVRKAERALEERARALIADLQSLLDPLIGPRTPLGTAIAAAQQAAAQPSAPPLSFVLFVDAWLQSLPFEGLDLFDESANSFVSRDFSLHLLRHRQRTVAAYSSGSAIITANNMRVLCDPWSDDMSVSDKPNTTSAVRSSIQAAAGGAKWSSLRDQGLVSVGDVLLTLDASNTAINRAPLGLFAFSFGRLGSLLSPADLSTANLERLLLLLSIDHSHNDTSFRRQNSIDVLKQPQELFHESPLAFTALASLCGAACVVSHAWSTPQHAQRRLVGALLQNWTVKKASLGMSLQHSSMHAKSDGAVQRVKKWIRMSRQTHGIATIQYHDT